ncbi:PREDICTED: uncharacterized protein LOC109241721 [Nicotiana attenuata]|uniref:uncharacterized protein LOC109241721 n=1 Tax=Nicotiana attenuata TaxID=49451 RepID=UPI000904E3B6|nr:PREDICTED: uncharacterized protein LOC109241721 [Nicotiana attenuata]
MTDVHVSNDDETVDVISNPLPAEGKKRKGRGKTTGLSIQKKRKDSDNGKLKVIIPPDRTVAVGPGANDFINELSVKVVHNARHAVKNWKEVPDIAKDRIVAHMLRNTSTGKEPNLQKLWELTHMKNGHWVNDASAELHDKVKEYIAEQIQEIEEDTDLDPVVNAAFVKVVGETSSYCRGQGLGVNSTSKRSMNEIQEKLQAQQKEAKEERRKRESVECQLKEVKIKLEEERKNRESIMRDQKLLKESMVALASHILSNEVFQLLAFGPKIFRSNYITIKVVASLSSFVVFFSFSTA